MNYIKKLIVKYSFKENKHTMSNTPSYFESPHTHRRLAYRYTPPTSKKLTIVYLYGFRSDMNGEKVYFLESLCNQEGLGFLTLDYSGHGVSSGAFEDGTISQWLQDSLDLIDHITQGDIILVGSSMGGWIAHLVALQRPNRIVGLIGIASAPDFTQELIWGNMTPSQKTKLMNEGQIIVATEYNTQGWTITKSLVEDGRKHLILGRPIPLSIPIRYLHGLKDISVPPIYSQKLLDNVTSNNVTCTLIKSGDHRLSEEDNKHLLGAILLDLVQSSL